MKTKIISRGLLLLVLLGLNTSRADEVTDWNKHMLTAMHTASTSPGAAPRLSAIIHGAIFDAVNGIARQYTPVRVEPNAPRGASQRAAAIQAGYSTLVALFPAQKADLDAKLAASLDGIGGSEHSVSVARGLAWGKQVAGEILAWRSADGSGPLPNPFLGGNAVGQWRPTPPANLPGAGPQFATMLPWVLESQSQFRPPAPPALASDAYTQDFNEVKAWGSATSLLRNADQTQFCHFWHAVTSTYAFNSLTERLAEERGANLLQNARLFAHLNLAMADAIIACFDAKYTYTLWRPVTAIPLAETDGNPATAADPAWTPLLVTPNHPEYISGHSSISGAAAAMLALYFGETPIWFDSDVTPGVVRVFGSFPSAMEEIANARIYGGIHYRTACTVGVVVGSQVADHVRQNSLQRLHVNGND